MSDLSYEDTAGRCTDSPDISELGAAGHFEHIAHMNVFESHLWPLRIPVKMCPLGPGSTNQGRGDTGAEEDPASGTEDNTSLLLDQVKQDVLQIKGHSGEENQPITSPMRKNVSEKKKKSGRTQTPDNGEREGWERAKGMVEEFLDFPAMISSLSYRKRTEPNARPFWTNSVMGDDQTEQCEPPPLPNTRHNALFLRDCEGPYWQVMPHRWGPDTPCALDLGQNRTSPTGNGIIPEAGSAVGKGPETPANGQPEWQWP
ncbi:hypothetical protein XENTR_v10007565 [Xenopus tropicalis]|uniref:Uncharacterized protein LOC116409669 n=1 Tax=Xenopus tropicalis TaxID=8364 RepID=A0A8J1J8Y8_XENTR|nr:uncharacterized protein LOC116409669 [Xenopus tropicalis]KAE8613099.1 hypothetical protein XENTR_v10007565 [Xenopus tropicalis]